MSYSIPAIFPGEPGGGPAITTCDCGDLIGDDDWRPCDQPAVIIDYVPECRFPDDSIEPGFFLGFCARHDLEFRPRPRPPEDIPF